MMSKRAIWMVLVVMIIVSQSKSSSYGCLDHERIALLELNTIFQFLLESEQNSDDCCQWDGVICSNTTKSVIELDLFAYPTNSWEVARAEWYLNITLFVPFHKLQKLAFRSNEIAEFVDYEGFKGASKLSNLEILDLSNNNFNNSILPFLSTLPSLKVLNLASNALQGTLHIQDTLLNLEELDISFNYINKFVSPKGDMSLSKLKVLTMNAVHTDAFKLLQSMGSLLFLKTLDLSTNTFDKTVFTPKIYNIPNVEELFLDGSIIHTNLFQRLDAFSSLKTLDMFGCVFNGQLNSTVLHNFKKLEILDLSASNAPYSESFLQNIRGMNALKVLRLRDSALNGTLLASQGLCDSRHLQELDLNGNNLVGPLPTCLANLTSLQYLCLSNSQLTGNISESPLTSMMSLTELFLENNHFQIPISLGPFFNHSRLSIFEGAYNEIYADDVPRSLVPKFQLIFIELFACGEAGVLPQFLYHQHDLENVLLYDNNLIGNFPNWLLANNSRLSSLSLGKNSLSGQFDLQNHSHTHITTLDISQNLLNGSILADLGELLPNLVNLNMSSNRFDGNIPSSFGYMNFLQTLDLSNNQLSGKIPDHLDQGCVSLQWLILSNNSLHGQIFSKKFRLVSLELILLDKNHFTGKIHESLSNSSYLSVLDISNNYISGPIPIWMGNLSSLQKIKMENNHLESQIPVEFCNLTNLETLDISGNDILGSLPSCLSHSLFEVLLSKNRISGLLYDIFSNGSSISVLDLSNNHLTGSIPQEIKRFPHLTFLLLNNNHLEGEVPTEICKLKLLSWLDLSHNRLFGEIPKCLHITMVEEAYKAPVDDSSGIALAPEDSIIDQPIVFTTKWMTYTYQGIRLEHMSGVDLSCNNFSGEIPLEIGNLSNMHSLNLSHNSLFGPIPKTFENLKHIECMDLSNNFLSGKIPEELVDLYTLEVFSVINNNLSGEVPSSGQFGGFTESSYEGNPHLCGIQLRKSCRSDRSSGSTILVDHGEVDGFMNMTAFYASLVTTFFVVLLGLATVLLVNSYWRRWWFYHVENWTFSCYYFVVDNLPKRRFLFRT